MSYEQKWSVIKIARNPDRDIAPLWDDLRGELCGFKHLDGIIEEENETGMMLAYPICDKEDDPEGGLSVDFYTTSLNKNPDITIEFVDPDAFNGWREDIAHENQKRIIQRNHLMLEEWEDLTIIDKSNEATIGQSPEKMKVCEPAPELTADELKLSTLLTPKTSRRTANRKRSIE